LNWLPLLGAVALFAIGMRLSALFSGSETGFYRVSFLRLNIDANEGDPIAKRLCWYAQNPSYFVATTLIGNNLANDLTTIAISIGIAEVFQQSGGSAEIVTTILFTPIIFIFGEMVPKNLYYRSPSMLLKRYSRWFDFFYRAFWLISTPLVAITRYLERFSPDRNKPAQLVLGRQRLVKVLEEGHLEGLLSNSQKQLVRGMFNTAAQSVKKLMIPQNQITGVTRTTDAGDIIQLAQRNQLSFIPIRARGNSSEWTSYLKLVDLITSPSPIIPAVYNMPRLQSDFSMLESLYILRNSSSAYGAIFENDKQVGIVSQLDLVKALCSSDSPLMMTRANL
jgi:CBS domain containing-hemolysin-like protein|tara:strand:- start:23295 stop:24302 length:1008 start_codon:yes stop_codon:yes gene_type:complete